MTALTPEVLAELRELASNASWPYGCLLADRTIAALPALLDAAEELERVKRWAGCRQCQNDHTKECDDCVVNWKVTKFKPVWDAEAAK